MIRSIEISGNKIIIGSGDEIKIWKIEMMRELNLINIVNNVYGELVGRYVNMENINNKEIYNLV